MSDTLDWLVNHRVESVEVLDNQWDFKFSRQVTLSVECLWRLLENDRVVLTACDHEQLFGLNTPIDAASELSQKICNAQIDSVALHAGTLDLALAFSSRHRLQIIPDSSGYEAWQLSWGGRQLIATGGGRLIPYPLGENRG
jgi:hypothetical protein